MKRNKLKLLLLTGLLVPALISCGSTQAQSQSISSQTHLTSQVVSNNEELKKAFMDHFASNNYTYAFFESETENVIFALVFGQNGVKAYMVWFDSYHQLQFRRIYFE